MWFPSVSSAQLWLIVCQNVSIALKSLLIWPCFQSVKRFRLSYVYFEELPP